ncbi:MAG: hypothetical protein KKA79_02725, partial [Nanoarchaeota archaeon]|nr:hypothetical protein [Nanoarchaeota archaeon]
APMLYALSSFLVEVLTKVLSQVEMPKTSMAMPITISAVSIDPGFIITYVITAMVITAILGSMVLGLIKQGEEKQGLKYAPMLVAFALGVFFVIRFLISALLSGLFII